MKTTLLGLLAETPIHAGASQSRGVVDQPVAREAATGYPVIPGSSLKGALRELTERKARESAQQRFGEADHAGELLVGEARLLLLPVRSLTSAYCWLTCPLLLERLRRDLQRAGREPRWRVPAVPEGSGGVRAVLAQGQGGLFLEEREFEIRAAPPEELSEAIAPLMAHAEARARLGAQLAVLRDEDFAWFARYGLPLQARNALEDGTKKSHNLWYEESLPPDTLLHALVGARTEEAAGLLPGLFPARDAYLQLGGNETVGQGWFAVTVHPGGEARP
jgi:CRISPR-associated protein Cmr4